MYDMKEEKEINFKELINEKQSSISIEKNSKGYNWSIKLYYNEAKTKNIEVIEELKRIDNKLKIEFGNGDKL
jgi:hypothetical protein